MYPHTQQHVQTCEPFLGPADDLNSVDLEPPMLYDDADPNQDPACSGTVTKHYTVRKTILISAK